MDLRKTVADILGGSSDKKIDEVTKILNIGGVSRADDLKNFNWNSLKELGGLSAMDINKIMRYIQENFPDDYEEHKMKRIEERKLQYEADILKCNADHERKLQMKMGFQKNKEARMKEQRELEEELTRSLQDQQNSSKKPDTTLEEASNGIFKKFKELTRIPWPLGNKDKEMTVEEVISKILKGCDETRIATVASLLSGRGARTAEDIKQYNSEILKSIEGLSDEERNKIMKFIGKSSHEGHKKHKQTRNKPQTPEVLPNYKVESFKQNQLRSDLKQEIAKILKISDPTRVEEISNALQKDGLKAVDELRFYDCKSLETLGMLTEEISEIMEIIKGEFPETYERHKRRRDNETQKMEELSKYKNIGQEQLKTRDEKMNIEDVILKIFDGCSDAVRIWKIEDILCDNGIKRADDLSHFDWKSLEDFGLTSAEANRIMDFVKKNFPKDYKRHEKRRDEENRMKEELSKYKADESRQQNPSKLDEKMNIEEVIHKIFDGCSAEARIGKIKEILCYNGLKRADDLSHFDWKSLEDLGLTSPQANRIMDFVKKNFPKDYKRHLKRRDEENRMKEELSKYKTEIIKPSKLGIEEAVANIFGKAEVSKIESVTRILKSQRIKMAVELKYFERDSLAAMGLDGAEINKIMAFVHETFSKNCEKFKDKIKKDEGTQVTGDDFKELTVEEAVAKILEGCSSSRMYFVTMTLMEEGASTSKEMKYFDRNNLEELGVLENEEIDKIVKFIQES